MDTNVERIIELARPVNAGRYRNYLEGLKPAVLEARLQQLEHEHTTKPFTSNGRGFGGCRITKRFSRDREKIQIPPHAGGVLATARGANGSLHFPAETGMSGGTIAPASP